MRVRVVLPDAPERPVTINGGMRMRAWYDIDPAAGLDSGREDIEVSAGLAQELIEREEARGIATERKADAIVLNQVVLNEIVEGFTGKCVLLVSAGKQQIVAVDHRRAG